MGRGTAAPAEPDSADETQAPAAKWPRMDYCDPFSCLEALLEADPLNVSRPTNVEKEIAAYLDQPPILCTSCVKTWWRENESHFPGLARAVQRYLGAPCMLVASERLFSYAGNIFTDQCSRLAADRAEKIIVKHDLRAIDYD